MLEFVEELGTVRGELPAEPLGCLRVGGQVSRRRGGGVQQALQACRGGNAIAFFFRLGFSRSS